MSSGSYGECDGAGGGRDRERRALPERRQRPASQIYQRVGPRTSDHHVASGLEGEKDQRLLCIYTNLTENPNCARERERGGGTDGQREGEEGGQKKEQKKAFFLSFLINLDSF